MKRGWSGDYGKDRLDVETEEDDLVRLLVEKGAGDPQAVVRSLTNLQASRLLDLEALLYGTLSRASDIADKEDPARKKLKAKAAAYRQERDNIVASLLRPKP